MSVFLVADKEEIMAAIERFEDIQGWQAARELTQMVYAASNRGAFARD